MSCKVLKTIKTAPLSAVFLFVLMASFKFIYANDASFVLVKQKATELLLQKKKNQALQLVINYSKEEQSPARRQMVGDYLQKLSQQFISKEAQEAYENSLNITLENSSEALKSVERCLVVENQNLDCMIQKIRLHVRLKNIKIAKAVLLDAKDIILNSKYEAWLTGALSKNDFDFKNKQILKKTPGKEKEEFLGMLFLELDRAFIIKNYSRAKELVKYFEKNNADWPDLIYYKNKLNIVPGTTDSKSIGNESGEQNSLYLSKCKALSKSIVRKYRYDLELCARATN